MTGAAIVMFPYIVEIDANTTRFSPLILFVVGIIAFVAGIVKTIKNYYRRLR